MKKFLWGLIFLSAVSAVGRAEASSEVKPSLELSARTDKTRVGTGELLNFSIEIAGALSETPKVEIRNFEGFSIVSTGQSQQIRVEEGKPHLTLTLSYILAPFTPGKHLLGPIEVEYQGQKYKTEPIEVTVIPGNGVKEPPRPTRRRIPNLEGGTVL